MEEPPDMDEMEWLAMESSMAEEEQMFQEQMELLDEMDKQAEKHDKQAAKHTQANVYEKVQDGDIAHAVEREKKRLRDAPSGSQQGGAEAAGPAPTKKRWVPMSAPTRFAWMGAAEQQEGDETEQQQQQQDHTGTDPSPSTAPEVPPPAARKPAKPCKRAVDIEGLCFSVTAPGGERVYVELEDDTCEEPAAYARASAYRNVIASTSGRKGLLSEPLDDLLEQIEQDRYDRALQESDAATARTAEAPSTSNRSQKEQLWVDKYAPRMFTDLLSDERTNREVLRWVKAWDACVFNKPLPASKKLPALHQVSGNHKPLKPWEVSEEIEFGPDGRPQDKVLLLCGSPGLGKTTLAHIVARHCGYRVVEVNASDDRSGAVLTQRITDAVQMQAVMGDRRPNCLVIDEIDGVSGGSDAKGAIEALIRIVQAEAAPVANASAPEAKSKKRSAAATARRLCRPIICICNDLFAPALRPLRQVARVYRFNQPSVQHVVSRLKYICKKEGFHVDTRALSALCEFTECDIRSCLNTLQFLHQQGKRLQPADLAKQVVGRKDMAQSALDVWNQIFFQRFRRRRMETNSSSSGSIPTSAQQREWNQLFSMLMSMGDNQLIMDGCFENLHGVRFHNGTLTKTVDCLDWLGDADLLMRRSYTGARMHLQAYVPAAAMAMRHIASATERPKLEWPKSLFKLRQDQNSRRSIVDSWIKGVKPATYVHMSVLSAVQDVISPLVTIISPKQLRPVAPQLLSDEEKALLEHVIDAMITLNLTYTAPSRGHAPIGLHANGLQPNLFAGPQLEPPIALLLQYQVELETIRRAPSAQPNSAEQPSTSNSKQKSAHISTPAAESAKPAPDTRQAHKEQQPQPTRKPTFLDAFRNINRKRAVASAAGGAQPAHATLPVIYKFHEGFTNAVRRPVYMKDLL
eukprot:jgi/Chlat1/4226/Chrsp27S04307